MKNDHTPKRHPRFQTKKACHPVWWWLKNGAAAALVLLLLQSARNAQPTYDWVYTQLLRRNYALAHAYPDATFDQKMEMKLGESYRFLRYIRQSTPEDAVILFPSTEDFRTPDNPFKQEIHNKLFATRFLYPRRLVQRQELGQSPYAERITHVVVVNGRGKDDLPYPVGPDVKHAVMPLHR